MLNARFLLMRTHNNCITEYRYFIIVWKFMAFHTRVSFLSVVIHVVIECNSIHGLMFAYYGYRRIWCMFIVNERITYAYHIASMMVVMLSVSTILPLAILSKHDVCVISNMILTCIWRVLSVRLEVGLLVRTHTPWCYSWITTHDRDIPGAHRNIPGACILFSILGCLAWIAQRDHLDVGVNDPGLLINAALGAITLLAFSIVWSWTPPYWSRLLHPQARY